MISRDILSTTKHERLQSLLFTAIEQSTDSILISDDQGTIQYVNPAFEQLTGYTREEAIGENPRLLKSGQHDSAFYGAMWTLLKAGKVWNGILTNKRKDGTLFQEEASITPITDEQGKITHYVAVKREITERLRREQLLAVSEQRLQLALHATNIGPWDWNLQTNVVFFSPEWKRQIGYADHEITSQYSEWESRIHPDDLPQTLAGLKNYLERRSKEYDTEFRFRHKNGSYRWIHTRAELIKDVDGKPWRLTGCHVDITQRRQAEEDLKESERKVRLLLDSAAEGIYGVDTEGICTFVNRAGLSLLKYEKSGDLVGKNMHLTIHHTRPDGSSYVSAECPMHQTIRDGNPFHKDHEILWRSDGLSFPCEFWSHPVVKEGHVTGAVVSFVDITERRQSENIARRAEKMSAVGQLASGVAHEINNPLGVILGFAQAALRRLPPEDPLEMPLKSIEREALRCQALAKDLLVFSRTSKADREPMDLNRAVDGSLSLVMSRAKLTQIDVRKELAAGLPLLSGNANEIQQVVINLAGNALDAMETKGTLTIKTEKIVETSVPYLCLSVKDTGPGIPADVQPHIFEPFFTTKPEGKGTGLGLSLVHEIVSKHSGMIDVQSRPGHTVFCIKFPIGLAKDG